MAPLFEKDGRIGSISREYHLNYVDPGKLRFYFIVVTSEGGHRKLSLPVQVSRKSLSKHVFDSVAISIEKWSPASGRDYEDSQQSLEQILFEPMEAVGLPRPKRAPLRPIVAHTGASSSEVAQPPCAIQQCRAKSPIPSVQPLHTRDSPSPPSKQLNKRHSAQHKRPVEDRPTDANVGGDMVRIAGTKCYLQCEGTRCEYPSIRSCLAISFAFLLLSHSAPPKSMPREIHCHAHHVNIDAHVHNNRRSFSPCKGQIIRAAI